MTGIGRIIHFQHDYYTFNSIYEGELFDGLPNGFG